MNANLPAIRMSCLWLFLGLLSHTLSAQWQSYTPTLPDTTLPEGGTITLGYWVVG